MVFVYTKTLLAGAMKPLNVLSKFENHFANQTVRFSSSTWSGRLFFCSESFCICSRSKQGELVPTHDFWIWFYKSDFKNDCWASPKSDIQHKNALVSPLNDRWISKFLGEKFVLLKSSLIHLISHKTGTITSGFEGKKRKYHFLKIRVLLWYALFRAVHRTGPTMSGLLPQNRTCQVLKNLLKVW